MSSYKWGQIVRVMAGSEGVFVTIDGPRGVGKSTILHGAGNKLRQLGFDVLETKEPTQTYLGKLVREAEEVSDYKGKVLACLVAADRYFHLDYEVLPAISQGKIVLSDRYVESSLVLQRLDGLELEFVWQLNSRATVPDLSIILTANPSTLSERLECRNSNPTRLEREHSREIESSFYSDASAFLSSHGFEFLILDNATGQIDQNIGKVTSRIVSICRSAASDSK